MNKNISRHAKSIPLAKLFGILLVLAFVAGCGADWFPEYKRPATLPDSFTFTRQTDVEPGKPVTSNAITVSGVTAASSPITITATGTSSSQYSINGGTPTSAAGTVKNGDTVTVTHIPLDSPGAVATSTVTIGGLQGAFTTVNQLVDTPVFTVVPTTTGIQAYAQLTALDSNVVHQISISDNSGVAKYQITDLTASQVLVAFTNATITRTGLNNTRLYVQVPTASVVVKLTIDKVEFDLTMSSTGVAVTRVQPAAS